MSVDFASGRDVFGTDLLRDEEVLWYAQPELSGHFTRADVFLIPFGVFWTLFSLFWTGAVLAVAISGEPAALIGALFGIPFVAIGFYMLFGRFWYKRWVKRRTHYAVTNRRIISLGNALGRHLSAAYIDRLPSMRTARHGREGVGTIWFGNTPWWVLWYGNTGMEFLGSMYGEPPVAFYDIKDVDRVVSLVDELRNA